MEFFNNNFNRLFEMSNNFLFFLEVFYEKFRHRLKFEN